MPLYLDTHFLSAAIHRKYFCAEFQVSNVITSVAAVEKGITARDYECHRNYSGSSKAMEADGALSLVKDLNKKLNRKCTLKL